jgi:hypothetical protein
LLKFAASKGFDLSLQDKVALALGSISGYYAGVYTVTRSYRPACNDPKVLAKLQSKQYWEGELLHSKIRHIFESQRLVFPTRNVALVYQTDALRPAADSLPAQDKEEFLSLLRYVDWVNGEFSDSDINLEDLLVLAEKASFPLFDFLKMRQSLLAQAYPGQTPPVLGYVFPSGGSWEGENDLEAETRTMILSSGEAAGMAAAQRPLVRRTIMALAILIAIPIVLLVLSLAILLLSGLASIFEKKQGSHIKKRPPSPTATPTPA